MLFSTESCVQGHRFAVTKGQLSHCKTTEEQSKCMSSINIYLVHAPIGEVETVFCCCCFFLFALFSSQLLDFLSMSVRTSYIQILCNLCLHPHLFLFSFNIFLLKGEMSFEQDCLVEGGCLSQMHNGTAYREVRQFRSAHHLVRFYFVTRIYSRYMMSILEDFHSGLKPDIVIVNSCIWDISRLVLELI